MTIPDDARAQLDALTAGIADDLGDDLVGVYLHGSLVLGCFNPQRSDVDVLVITRRPLDDETRRRIAPILLDSSGQKERPRTPPYPLEVSFLTEAQLHPWRYPTPYDVHFSESWRPRVEDGSWTRGGEDYDLAAHITVVRAAGIALQGPPPLEVFPDVPHADFVDSLLRDLDWCRKQNWKFYSVLSASRIWATLSIGGVQSKETGAVWALERAPAEFRPLIEHALAVYRGEIDDAELDFDQANRYVDFVRAELTKA